MTTAAEDTIRVTADKGKQVFSVCIKDNEYFRRGGKSDVIVFVEDIQHWSSGLWTIQL